MITTITASVRAAVADARRVSDCFTYLSAFVHPCKLQPHKLPHLDCTGSKLRALECGALFALQPCTRTANRLAGALRAIGTLGAVIDKLTPDAPYSVKSAPEPPPPPVRHCPANALSWQTKPSISRNPSSVFESLDLRCDTVLDPRKRVAQRDLLSVSDSMRSFY